MNQIYYSFEHPNIHLIEIHLKDNMIQENTPQNQNLHPLNKYN